MRAGRACSNFVAEISYKTSTTQLINQCSQYFRCANVQYVLGIDILDILNPDLNHGRVRLVAHLFQRDVNNNEAPIRITYFGNSPQTVDEGGTYLDRVIQDHYHNYGNDIQVRGTGFPDLEPPLPLCNQANLDEYLLYLDQNLLLQDAQHNLNLNGIPNQNNIAQCLYIDLYEVQRHIRAGLYVEGIFQGPRPPELQGL
jgi:hypothetical protein